MHSIHSLPPPPPPHRFKRKHKFARRRETTFQERERERGRERIKYNKRRRANKIPAVHVHRARSSTYKTQISCPPTISNPHRPFPFLASVPPPAPSSCFVALLSDNNEKCLHPSSIYPDEGGYVYVYANSCSLPSNNKKLPNNNTQPSMDASLKRRFQYMQPDLIPLAVRPPRPPPPPSSPDHHHLLPKRRLDDFPAATAQRHDHHAYAGGQLIMRPNMYPKLQPTTPTSSSIFDPTSLFSSTCTSFNPLHGDSSAPPPASLTPSTTPPVFPSAWAAPGPLLPFPYLLPAGHVLGGVTGHATTSSLPPLVELGNNKKQLLGAADDKVRARKAVNEKNLQRRRRIREKLISLEKLVPATRRRLNKAAMLEEACKYIRFLEAQVKALSSMRRPAALPSFSAAVPRELEELSQEQVLEMMVNSEKTQAVLSEKGWCVVSLEQAEVLKSALQSLLLKQKLMASSQMTEHLHLGHHLQPY